MTVEHNLAYACFECNPNKGANIATIDPLDEQIVRLFDPRTHLWAAHFTLQDGRILGLTPVGRVTAQLLRLNTDTRVRQRQLLIEAGVYLTN